MTSLSLSQLNAALTSEQIGRARDEKLVPVEPGQPAPDPVAEEIAAACAKVDAYIAGFLLAPALATAYARDIAAWYVAKRLSKPTAEQTKAHDRSLLDLEAIRAGDFPGLEPDPDATPAKGKVRGGSRKNILPPAEPEAPPSEPGDDP